MADDDDDPVELSAHALNALNEFYREQSQLLENSTNDQNVDEDWELSQFWYDDETSNRLANECLRLIDNSDSARIACISCPTLFKALRGILNSEGDQKFKNVKLTLFEYDRRFELYEDYVFYDYRQPLHEYFSEKGQDLRNSFDVVVADPPFLSEECVNQVGQFVRTLLKPGNGKIIFCTGLIVEQFIYSALDEENMRICETFEPRHQRKLGNEFRCYVNYEDAFP